MTSLLEAMGFGDMFLHVKKSLYSSSTATLLINGLRSGNVLLQRGTWQGCPFSPLLFAICMEPLAHRIRCHPEIQGLRTQTMEHKVSLFADDMMAYVSYPSTSLKYLQEELDQFGELSGLRLTSPNQNCSQFIFLLRISKHSTLCFLIAGSLRRGGISEYTYQ